MANLMLIAIFLIPAVITMMYGRDRRRRRDRERRMKMLRAWREGRVYCGPDRFERRRPNWED